MDKHYEAVKEILEDQIKKIVKKGDISPQELDSLYKASAIVLDFETKEAMKKSQEQQHQQMGANAPNGGVSNAMGSYDYAKATYNNRQSNHYPWFMYYNDGSYDMSNRGNSYGPVWNQQEKEMMHNMSNETNSHASYTNAYDGAYDGAYDASNDNSYDNSYRRGRDARTGRYVSRDANYSRSMNKERMISKLEDMIDDATTEKERRALQQCVDKLER